MSADSQLLAACTKGDIEEVQSLLAAGANAAYEFYEDGTWGAHERRSPIHCAVVLEDVHARMTITRLLLEHKANLNARKESYDWRGCGHGTTATEMVLEAVRYGNADASLFELCLEYKANPNSISRSDISSMRSSGHTQSCLLTEAASNVNVQLIRSLLKHQAEPDNPHIQDIDNEYGWRSDTWETALHICAGSRSEHALEAVELLVEAGADVNLIRKYLDQVQDLPKKKKREPVEEEVCENDEEPEMEEYDDDRITDPRDPGYQSYITSYPMEETAVHLAIKSGQAGVVKYLLDHGADLTIPHKRGAVQQSAAELIASSHSNDEALQRDLQVAIGTRSLAKSARS